MDFNLSNQACIGCGACVKDCPSQVLALANGKAVPVAERVVQCIECQHCLAICPIGALSICGIQPEECLPLAGALPRPEQLEALIMGRRSIRHFQPGNLPPDEIRRLIEVTSYAPTGVNSHQVLLTVVDDAAVMEKLRQDLMKDLIALVRAGKLPENLKFFAHFVKAWEERQLDIVFRGAPHLLLTSAPTSAPCAEQDCLIAMTTFELFAQTLGIGTCWDGIAKWALTGLLPHYLERLGIPKTHHFGYAMVFGRPAVRYPRTVKRPEFAVHRVTGL